MSNNAEKTPLLRSTSENTNASASTKYYFLGKSSEAYQGGTTNAVRDADGEQVVEGLPYGASEEEFAPRILAQNKKRPSQFMNQSSRRVNNPNVGNNSSISNGVGGFLNKLIHGGGNKMTSVNSSGGQSSRPYGDVGTLVKLRKAPIKIEPKVFFANERTFLAWMHLSVILAGASIAILAFAEDNNPFSQLYGVILLPVAIAFIVYSMYQYWRRSNMIRHRHPGPYEDTVGPVVLGVLLMMSIVAQFAIKLYAMANV